MKSVLLIGKTGQLGEAIMADSESFGFEIKGLGRADLDVTNSQKAEGIIKQIGPDILINTTAYNLVTKAELQPEEAMAINCEAVANMARICNERGIKFVTFSTDYVFDGRKGAPYEENDTPHPLQVYGRSKLAGEIAALKYHPSGSLVIRTNGVYGGEKGSPGKGNFVLNILKEAEGKDTVDVSCEQIVSPTYAGDLSVATLKLLQKDANPGIYHLVNEGYCSWYEFTKEIFRLAGVSTKPVPVDRGGLSGNIRRPKFSALQNTKAGLLGVALPSWQEGLSSYFTFLNLYEKK